jgi:pyridoxal biosynthesis lyase PdxS
MSTMVESNGSNGGARVGTDRVKQGLAQMLKGGVIVSAQKCWRRCDAMQCDVMEEECVCVEHQAP